MTSKRFTDDAIRRIVEESLRPGCRRAELCREHGISRRTLKRWSDALRPPPAVPPAVPADPTAPAVPEVFEAPAAPAVSAEPPASAQPPLGDDAETVQGQLIESTPEVPPSPAGITPVADDAGFRTPSTAILPVASPPPETVPADEEKRQFWKRVGAIVFFALLTMILSWGPCLLVNRLIGRLGAFAAYAMLLAGLTPLSALILSQCFWKATRNGLKKIRNGDILTAFLFVMAVILCNLGLLIVPNLICFLLNLGTTVF